MVIKNIYIFIAFLVLLSVVSGDEAKGSVAFVIDDTISMSNELAQVTARTDDIFEAVLKSNASQTNEFIIVTFNDPEPEFRVKTNDSVQFKSALEKITPHGGDDCPEMAMSGILLALLTSKPHSFLYVFTDASAKDYLLYDYVKALAQEKSTQVNFLLTGDCVGKTKTIIIEEYTVYDNLAAATSGQVFHIFKDDVDKIFEYILANLRSKRINLLRKTYGQDKCEKSTFTVDSKEWDILIALSSPTRLKYTNLFVYGPHGDTTSLDDFIYTSSTSILKMRSEPGEYTIKMENCANITVVVSASTSVSFQHGFSSVKPTILDETSTIPVLGTESYLAIELTNEERDVTLKSVEIRDMDNNAISPLLTLQLIDDEKQFYITDLFTPPKETFMIAVNGYTKSNENITRLSQTSIDYYKTLPESSTSDYVTDKVENISYFNVLEYPKDITVEFGEPVELNFKIDAQPLPTIKWYQDEVEIQTNEDIEIITSPEGSSLKIKSAKPILEGKYYVMASNVHHKETKIEFNITVTTKKKAAIVNMIEKKYYDEQTIMLNCKVEGFPEPIITWEDKYHNVLPSMITRKTPPYEYESSLYIDKATGSGTYTCKANNFIDDSDSADVDKKKEENFVLESPTEVPRIDKNKIRYTTLRNRNVDIECRVIQGTPDPVIKWSFDRDSEGKFIQLKETREQIHIDPVTQNDVGTYRCDVSNEVGTDHHEMQLYVEYAPMVKVPSKYLESKKGDRVKLACEVDGSPAPIVRWYVNGSQIYDARKYTIERDNTLSFTGLISDSGTYTCEASNYLETERAAVFVFIHEVPRIDKNKIRYTKLRNRNVDIECRVIQGTPYPVITWSFDRGSAGKFIQLKESRDIIHIGHVTQNDVGTYRCDVSNVFGTDHHEMQLYVEYAPMVNIPSKYLESKKGERVKLACEVDGSPAPIVRWYVNGSQIYDARKYTIDKNLNNTLSFTGLILDSGTYTCEASNYLETASAAVYVFIHVPTKIKPPKVSKIDANLRERHILFCEVNGYPVPKVQWFHYAKPPTKTGPQKIACDQNYNVILDAIQFKDEGSYECTADNNIDSDAITYTVNVQVPATIDRKMVTNDLQVVEGDPSFVLTCPATGSPKPTIKWHRDGIEIGSDALFTISKDGSLTVNNVVLRHSGTYTCTAQNQYNKDTMNYDVYVHAFPPTESNALIITITEGEKKHDMYCGMVLQTGFVVRWFKDGVFIRQGHLTLYDVKKNYAGFYTCRLSTPRRSYSFHKRVIVGAEPKFITAHNTTVMFMDGTEATFDCSATGDPLPTIKWWYENRRISNADSNQYSFKMDAKYIGKYSCSVSNEFGTIKRSFSITAGECLMSVKNDFTARQPMLVTGKNKRQWPIFNVSGGTLRMQKYRQFTLVCPEASISYDNTKYESILETYCVGDSLFKLRGVTVKASEITCDRSIVPLAKNLSNSVCRGKNTKLFYVGFDVNGAFVPVFSVCWNEITNTVLFVTHQMHNAIAHTMPKYVAGYTRGTLLRIQFEDIYDCRNQEYAILSFMGHTVDKKCCFKRRQLVNPMDVLPGISQVAAYHYLNVVPHWSCGTENWEEVERRVRQYAINSQDKIRIWTGASVSKNESTINLKDNLGQELQVPQFIWKVVQHQLAIIHINVPGLTSSQAISYTLCRDICDSIDWMKNSQWHDFDRGFIYCCTIEQFEIAFTYEYIFN